MKIWSPLPRSTTLVSPVTRATPGLVGGFLHGADHAPQVRHRQALLQDEARRQIERPGAAHGEVVYGAMDGQLPDVAAGEEDGVDDKRIGAEGNAGPVHGEDGAIVERFEELIAELGQHHLLDQLVGELAATAVGEHDFLMVHDRHRAGAQEGAQVPHCSLRWLCSESSCAHAPPPAPSLSRAPASAVCRWRP